MNTVSEEYHALLRPSAQLVDEMKKLEGDILILGAGGKMGPSLALLAKQAIDKAGIDKKVIAVSRFTEKTLVDKLSLAGIEVISADLLGEQGLACLPAAENVLYLAGTKFGTTGNEPFTWAMNSFLPGLVAAKYKRSRIVAFSTGNVYPLTPVVSGGATEEFAATPNGEYAQSCLGRERLFQYHSIKHQTPLLLYRLNYANDTSYGVLLEVARAVKENRPVNLAMGNVNVIWQGDANEMALRCFHHCSVPAKILNITGPETVSVRWLAHEFAKIFSTSPQFVNEEQNTALLSNAAEAFRLFGYPRTTLKTMINIVAAWLLAGGETINKPTHFEARDGKY